jgi:hypothetical protein
MSYHPDDGFTSTYETSVNFYQTTQRNNPEDSHLDDRSSVSGLCMGVLPFS